MLCIEIDEASTEVAVVDVVSVRNVMRVICNLFTLKRVDSVRSRSNWNLEVLVFIKRT